MKKLIYIPIVSISLLGCGQSENKPVTEAKLYTDTTTKDHIEHLISEPDTSNQAIYNFMKVVIADQKLDLNYGLTLEPQPNFDLSQDDQTFLNTMLIDNKKEDIQVDTGNWVNTTSTISSSQLNKCLTKPDIKFMLEQKARLKIFSWDNSRLGFNLNNRKNWYVFSVPVFSQDKKKVVMMIRNLCPGLCGTGWTILFEKEKGEWTSQATGQWYH
ncbi:MAG: hypothetical protein V4538_12815 [Bacteroidota bacterium]